MKLNSVNSQYPSYIKPNYQTSASLKFSAQEGKIKEPEYTKAFNYHLGEMMMTNVDATEKRLAQMGIDATFNTNNVLTNKILAYCVEKTAQIYQQLGLALPKKIDTLPPEEMEGATAWCNWGTCNVAGKVFPIRSIAINENIPVGEMLREWKDLDEVQADSYRKRHNSARHFLDTFVHEFAHNAHYDNLFAKYGCPEHTEEYTYRPETDNLFREIKATKNPFANLIREKISTYGATSFFEAAAEDLTREILNPDNIDYMSLKLKSNPLPARNPDDTVASVVYEAWNGLVNDGEGLI